MDAMHGGTGRQECEMEIQEDSNRFFIACHPVHFLLPDSNLSKFRLKDTSGWEAVHTLQKLEGLR
jgi:hypothetical protein